MAITANPSFAEYDGRRTLSSRVRRPVVGSKPRAVPPEEAPEPVIREAVPEHMQLFAEFFERTDNDKLDPFMTMHERQFLIERRAVLEYVPYLAKLQLTSLLPDSFETPKPLRKNLTPDNKAATTLSLKQGKTGKKSSPKSNLA